ncbi:MAG: SET domain-containing protein-lysine N-methyltransferase [Myxococcota bacterium]
MKRLSDLVVVRESSIHGKGVFAREPIGEGTVIGVYEGSEVERDGIYVLWIERDDGSFYGIEGRNELRYLNHSSNPNADFDDEELSAVRTIAPGDEITLHYGDAWGDAS